MTRLKLAPAALLVVAVVGFGVAGPGAGPPAPAADAGGDPARELVRRLGSDAFAEREAAQKRLREMGLRALPAVKAGAGDRDPEIARRCAGLVPQIRSDALKALVEAFAAEKEEKREPDHPVWARFKKVVGADKACRELFAAMIGDPRRAELLDDAEDDPDRAGDLYAHEAARIAERLDGVPALPNAEGPRGPYLVTPPTPAEVATFFYLGTYPASARAPADGGKAELTAFVNGDFAKGSAAVLRPPFPRLFGLWLHERTSRDAVEAGLRVAAEHNVGEALPVARRLAADEALPVGTRVSALPVLWKFGGRGDLPGMAALWDDPTEFRRGRVDDRELTVQARDVAVATSLLLLGEDPARFGFPVLQAKPWRLTRDYALFSPDLFGFWDDAAREATHKRARAWLDEQRKKEPRSAGDPGSLR